MKGKSTQAKSKKQNKKKSIAPVVKWKPTVTMGLGFPKKVITTLKYFNKEVISHASGQRVNLGYNLTSIFDPEIAVGGRKPLYSDQYFAIYNHYVVLGAKIKFDMFPYDGNLAPLNAVVWYNDDSTVVPSYEATPEQSGAKTVVIDHSRPMSKTLTYSARKTFGSSVLANANLRGSSTTNPNEAYTAYVSTEAVDLVTPYNVAVATSIEYVVCFFELKDIASS